jgi:dephospho-CoA kinase
MGKSTAAKFFAEEGVPVHDSDAVVHALYEGEAVPFVEAAFPGSTTAGKIDRTKLAPMVIDNPAALAQLEAIVHPLVATAREKFLAAAQARGDRIVVLDIPLLFETSGDCGCDAIVVISAPPHVQRRRAKQMPDEEKRRRAHFVVDSSQGFEHARGQIRDILQAVAKMPRRQQ